MLFFIKYHNMTSYMYGDDEFSSARMNLFLEDSVTYSGIRENKSYHKKERSLFNPYKLINSNNFPSLTRSNNDMNEKVLEKPKPPPVKISQKINEIRKAKKTLFSFPHMNLHEICMSTHGLFIVLFSINLLNIIEYSSN